MIEIGQNLPFIAKTAQDFISICPTLKNLDRDLLLKLPICSLPKIDSAHAPTTQFSDDGVGANPFANTVLLILIEACACKLCKLLEDRSIAGKKLFSFKEKRCIIRARSLKRGNALLRRSLLQGVGEDVLEVLPPHGP